MTETLSPVADLGQDKKEENGTSASNGKKAEDEAEKYDTLELRNRSDSNHGIWGIWDRLCCSKPKKQDSDGDPITG